MNENVVGAVLGSGTRNRIRMNSNKYIGGEAATADESVRQDSGDLPAR